MARKETISKNYVLETTFTMIKEQGYEEVTARKLAQRLGCSTQPIFRLYAGMSDLLSAAYPLATDYFHDYVRMHQNVNKLPFIDLGIAYVKFAKEESNLFKLLFLSEVRAGKDLYDLLNSDDAFVSTQIQKANVAGCKNSSELFMKMWIFIHGMACMCLTNDYDLTMDETVELLKETYYSNL